MRLSFVTLAAVLAVSPARAVPPPAPAPFTALSLVGRAVLPRDLEHEKTRVGGLSGLAWDGEASRFLAISDDRGHFGPVRVYRIRLEVGPVRDGRLPFTATVSVDGMTLLTDAKGRPFVPSRIDTEGIALLPGRLLVSTEAIVRHGIAAAITEHAPDGRLFREQVLPTKLLPAPGRGVRDNLGFEGLAATPDGRFLFAGLENALEQDGAPADVGTPSPARLLRFDLRAGGPPAEFVYVVDPVSPAPTHEGLFRVNGLSDVLPLGRDRLLVLERQFIDGTGNVARIWDVSLEGATDVSSLESLAGAEYVAARKTLLLDLAETGVALENFEGLAFGPTLPDGRVSLVVVSDDNFNPEQESTTFLVFAVDRAPVTPARIQGAGHRSPLEGSRVWGVRGVVTALERDPRIPGFFLESERPDDDPSTSEGLFVSWPAAASLEPGQAVSVSGRVEESEQPKSLSVTRLLASAVVPLGVPVELPPTARPFARGPVPSVVDDDALSRFEPASDALDFWESLEGMRIEVPAGAVVGPSSRRGDFVLRPDGSPEIARTAVGGVLLPETGPSLDRVFLSRPFSGEPTAVDVGARVDAPLVGIVDYSWGTYRVRPLAAPVVTATAAGRCDVTASLPGDRRRLSVASFNVENLSVAGPPERFTRIGERIARAMLAPDVVALEEVQDDSGPAGKGDGVVTSKRTLAALVEAVVAAGGPRYEAVWIDPVEGREGGQPGGNIRVALLLNPARVTLVRRGAAGPLDATAPEGGTGKDLRLTLSPGRVAPASEAFSPTDGEGVRRSLAVELLFRGKRLFVVANHLSSKSDDDRAFGSVQPPRAPTVARRLAQAREIRAFAQSLLAADPEARVVLLGDLNDFEHSEAVRHLSAPPLENLVLRAPTASRYTFNFEGASQVLDHVVVSPALAKDAEIEILHLNSDCSDEKRTSDHDPVVARLRPR
ncbi:MAG: esterase-like activity of phytase family protein [Thermoanaerobaculia bacterium]